MEDIVYKIMLTTIENETGLWEINWELNSLLPDNTSEMNKEIAKKILIYFLEENLVNLYSEKWGVDELTLIDQAYVFKIINEDTSWQPPSMNEKCYKVGNTQKGRNSYTKKLINKITF